jgi:hypothetical protein
LINDWGNFDGRKRRVVLILREILEIFAENSAFKEKLAHERLWMGVWGGIEESFEGRSNEPSF